MWVSRKARMMVAVLCGIAAFAACLLYGRQVEAKAERVRIDALERYGGEVVGLLVATRTLEYGDIIDASSVSTREWLVELAPDQALTSIEDVMGKQITVPLAKGLPLTQLNLRDGTSGLDVPSGYVALSLPLTDKLGLSRNISAGTRVVAYAVGSSGTVLLTGSALILASPVETTAFSSAQSISLAVEPGDVSAVLGASARGDLRLVVPAEDVEFDDEAFATAPRDVSAEDPGDLDVDDAGRADDAGHADDVPGGANGGAAADAMPAAPARMDPIESEE